MQVESKIYSQFKPYQEYKGIKQIQKPNKFNPKPVIGAAMGVCLATAASLKLKGIDEANMAKLASKFKNGKENKIYKLAQNFKKNDNGILYKLIDKLHLKESGKNTFIDVSEMILTAGAANVGAVGLNSVGKTDEQKKKKWKEAGFQIMNMAIPMLMTTAALKICESQKALNKIPAKIVGSIIGMTSGAFLATQITNLGKKENEPKRQYTIKDSIANFDDVVATVKIGFKEVEKIIPVSKILPFIYIYSASRAGAKGDDNE